MDKLDKPQCQTVVEAILLFRTFLVLCGFAGPISCVGTSGSGRLSADTLRFGVRGGKAGGVLK